MLPSARIICPLSFIGMLKGCSMSQQILWPPIGQQPPKTMAEMLYDAAVGLAEISKNKLDFYVDAVGVAPDTFGPVTKIRYNCYIRVVNKSYLHLLFQVTTPSSSPFDAEIGTPEGDKIAPAKNEAELRQAMFTILQRPQTTEIINYLLRVATP